MPTNTRPLPSRDPLDRTMARASSLVWPDAPQPTPFCDRTSLQYPIFKKKMASVVTKMSRALRTYWRNLSVDALPYSDELNGFMAKNWPTLRPAYYNAVCLTLYLTALRLRKTGELPTRKDALKTRHKTKARGKSKSRAR